MDFSLHTTGTEGRALMRPEWRLAFMTGVCGGYTTFSSFSLQTLNLATDGDWLRAVANVMLSRGALSRRSLARTSLRHSDQPVNCMTALQTVRLNLRPFSEDDLDDLSALMANADFMRFSLGVFSRKQTAGFLEKVRGRDREGLPSQFALIFRPAQKLIGYCGFFLQTVDDVEELEIAYRLDPSSWGQGIATEAARAVRDHAFDDLQLSHVISLIHPENTASRRVAEKNGMIPEKETIFRGFPTIVFGISREQRNGA